MMTWGQPIALAACATSSSSLSTSSQPYAAHSSDMAALASSSAAASNSRWFDPCGESASQPIPTTDSPAAHDLQRRELDVQFPKL